MKIMGNGCLILAAICILYYGIITVYAGKSIDFGWIWPAAAVWFFLLGTCCRSLNRTAKAVGMAGLLISLTAALAAGSIMIQILQAMKKEEGSDLDCVIVLGAQVRGKEPSKALRKRLECALDYAGKNPKTKLLLSGGQGSGEEISEAECMYEWLIQAGVSKERLQKEDQSKTTRENLMFSRKWVREAEDKTGIISNDFHIFRALKIARSCGYKKVVGICASSDAVMQPHYILRETAAYFAARLKGQL